MAYRPSYNLDRTNAPTSSLVITSHNPSQLIHMNNNARVRASVVGFKALYTNVVRRKGKKEKEREVGFFWGWGRRAVEWLL